MKKIIILILVTMSLTISIKAQDKHETSVKVAVERLHKAMIDADKNSLEQFVSGKLSYGHSSGVIDDKKEFVDKLVSARSDFVSIDITEQTISISGKTAIVRHMLKAKTNDGGKAGEVHLRVMQVWQKQGGKWRLLARQAVKAS